ncbi:DUF3095 family protein [Methylocapsa palsarum]|uniref:DUF3095 family protein n=1 Tax=Methylocapsa palsarum TaxID=1612308 RepID=UPI001587819A|nr:DUF3095 family protein [Methylocapsa palsarum]
MDASLHSGDAFFKDLPPFTTPDGTFSAAAHRRAPDDWRLAVTDVRNSTDAISNGLYKTVNFVAASSIAALKNLCAPAQLPFLFGGDGAVVMIPPSHVENARVVLARLRGLIGREFSLDLRVGLLSVREIRRAGAEALVGRYEPSPGNAFGVFLGGGVELLEAAVKSGGENALHAAASIPDALDDRGDLDLSGLSCRWEELRSRRGSMMSIIAAGEIGVFAEVYADVVKIAAAMGNPRPVRDETLAIRWPPKGYILEARARRKGAPLALAAARVLAETLAAWFFISRNIPIGSFDPLAYRELLIRNTDFSFFDNRLCFVLDCPADSITLIRAELSRRAEAGEIRFGAHVSESALMTCLVTSAATGSHVHFVDGGDGGYTRAAEILKRG